MKYASYGLLAAFLAQGVYAAIPTSAEGWYTPSGGFTRQTGTGTVIWRDPDTGNDHSADVTVDEEGKISGGYINFNNDPALMTAYNALVKACNNEAVLNQHTEAIQTIGDNLDSVFRADGIQMVMEKQGPGGSTTEATYTLRIKPGGSGGSSATIEATDPIPYGMMVDGKSIGWTRQDAQGQLSLFGIGSANGGQIAYANGAGGIVWDYPQAGVLFDDVTITTNGTGRAHLVGWSGGNECNTTLSDILTEEPGVNRGTHFVLTRYGTGNDAVFHYVPIGDRLSFGLAFDDKTVTTNDTGEVHLVDVENAEEYQIAFADGSGGILWDDSPPDVTYDSDNGVIGILPIGGTVLDDTYIWLPMINIVDGAEGYSFTWRDLGSDFTDMITIPHQSTVGFDDKTVTTNETGLAHLVGIGSASEGQLAYADGNAGITWKDAPAGTAFDDKTVTTNGTGKAHLVGIENATEGQLAFADGNDGIRWGDLPPGVQFDDKTVTTNETGKAHLVGIGNATSRQVAYADGNAGITWDDLPPGVQFDDKTITTNETGKAHLVGWGGGRECGTTLSSILTENSDGNRSSHYVLTRYGTGDSAVFHYVPMGDQMVLGDKVQFDDKTVTTNDTGEVHLVDVENAEEYQIAFADGSGGILWDDSPPDVTYDSDNGVIGILPIGGTVLDDTYIWLPMINIEEVEDGYLFTWRDLNGDDTYELTIPYSSGITVDGESITTNASDGAASQGVASLHGWASASADDLPQKDENGKLKWTSPSDMVDGTSLDWFTLEGGGKVWEVKDAHVYDGKHAKHYFGTSVDKTAALGWHELPNISTNRVEGDEVTISSGANIPGQQDDPDVKKLGLHGWNYNLSGEPLFVANNNGALDYLSLSSLTNLAACACTNKWLTLLGWIQDGELNDSNGITFESESMDYYMWHELGYIYATTPDNLYFDNSGSDIRASFDAPQNWADDVSIEEMDGVYQLKDFDSASACGASMSAMLSDPLGSDATTHLILAKKTDTGALHYVPIGNGVAGGGEHADGVTIVTNTAQGAATQGLLSLYGWSSAQDGKVLTKKNNAVSWEDGGTPPDDVTLAVVTEGTGAQATEKLSIKGFEAAENSSIPWKNENGEFVWGGASTVTNRILAGAGIYITDNGGGAITISAQQLNESSTLQTISVVTDVKYDTTTHKFQCKRRQITFNGTLGTAGDWEDVFEATSHKNEHLGE